MKKLLFAFLLLPLYSAAQFEVGVNGGWLLAGLAGTKVGASYGAGLYYRLTDVRFAAGYNADNLNINEQQHYAKPMSVFYAGVDYMWTIMYAGVDAGITSIPSNTYTATNITYYNTTPHTTTTTTTGSGIMYGMHVGFYFRVFKQLFVNAQVGLSDIKNTFRDTGAGYSASYGSGIGTTPVILGLHYKFRHKHKRVNVQPGS